jgi:hypothetical protein
MLANSYILIYLSDILAAAMCLATVCFCPTRDRLGKQNVIRHTEIGQINPQVSPLFLTRRTISGGCLVERMSLAFLRLATNPVYSNIRCSNCQFF